MFRMCLVGDDAEVLRRLTEMLGTNNTSAAVRVAIRRALAEEERRRAVMAQTHQA